MTYDHLDESRRSWNMSRIRGKDTWLELAVRALFSSAGIRYRLQKEIFVHDGGRTIRVRPDLQNGSQKWAVFANGCFWHFHQNCKDANVPKGGRIDWLAKLKATRERDARNHHLLLESGWKVLVIWECGMKHCTDDTALLLEFIRSGEGYLEWPAQPPRARTMTIRKER